MSIKIMNAVWHDPQLKGSDRLVLLALADNANDEGYCWPSLDTIAAKCNLSRRYVIDILKSLEGENYITRKHQHKESGGFSSTLYRVVIPPSLPSAAPLTTPSEAESTRVVRPTSLKPPLNHQIEPLVNPQEEKETALVFTTYSNEIGTLTPMVRETVGDAIKDYTADWIIAAFQIAVENNARRWNYVEAILKRWKVDGFQSEKRSNGKSKGKKTAMEIVDDWGKELGYE